jgi:capsular polysaccharide biosynthesis protein
MELRDYLAVVVERWRVAVGTLLLCVLVSFVYVNTADPVYTATSRGFLSVSVGQTPAELSRSYPYAQGLVRSYAQVATEAVVLQPVIDTLGLRTDVTRLARQVTAQAPIDTVFIDVTATDGDPERAARIANEVTDQLAVVVAKGISNPTQQSAAVRLVKLAPADVPQVPSSPRRGLALALGFVVGSLLAAVAAVTRDALDPRVRRARDTAAVTDLPLLGWVPAKQPRQRRRLRWGAARAAHRLRRDAYAARQLRRAFLRLQREHDLRSVAFTTARRGPAGEGAVVRLAASLAESGRQVLVVEADPPMDASAADSAPTGLAALLADSEAPVNDLVRPTPIAGLWLLESGGFADPSLLMDEPVLTATMRHLAKLYDVVLVKAPPALGIAHGLTVCRTVDGVVVVTDRPAMKRRLLVDELRTLTLAGTRLVGMILTK